MAKCFAESANLKTKLALLLGFVISVLSCRAEGIALPWHQGERLTYEVHWGAILAAEGTFTAKQDGARWQFNLDLQSRGLVEDLASIRDKMNSTVSLSPQWTVEEFFAKRSEASHLYDYVCKLGGGKKIGLYTNRLKAETKPIDLPGPSVDDYISMLYRMRQQDWDKEKSFDFAVSDRWKIYYGRARFVKMETLKDANGQARNCYLIQTNEIENGKLDERFYLKLWIPADAARVPLMAKLKFKYGTFTIKPKQG